MTPGLGNTYIPSTVTEREYKIVHYYSLNRLPQSDMNPLFGIYSNINNTESQLPYTLTTTKGVPIPGFLYNNSNLNIQFDKGILGFSFIPNAGVWDVKRFMFRSAITDYKNDPNQYINYLGIYLLSDIISKNSLDISFSNARIVLSNSSRVTYDSNSSYLAEGFDKKGGTYYEFIKEIIFLFSYYKVIIF
jgi:hypothetical protein